MIAQRQQILIILAVTAIVGVSALAATAAKEKPIQLSEVPKAAMDAAQAALGKPVTAAKVTERDGRPVYELETKDLSGKEKSALVTGDGKIVPADDDDDD